MHSLRKNTDKCFFEQEYYSTNDKFTLENIGYNQTLAVFVLDDDYVLMSKLDFDLLPDYTNSEPTGKYNGKMWKGQFNTTKR